MMGRAFGGRSVAAVAVAMAVALALPAVAFAYMEPNTIPGVGGCSSCHPAKGFSPEIRPEAGGDCDSCHSSQPLLDGSGLSHRSGPHGGYSVTSDKCGVCHSVHDAPEGGTKLLPAATIFDTCFTCHDGTGGWGVYGTIEARLPGQKPGGGHRYDATDVIPGGDPAGGSLVGAFLGGPNASEGAATTLTCTDCHSAHGSSVVEPFRGDRRRTRVLTPAIESDRLLKQRPTGAAQDVAVYGSDWCLACHAGRSSGGMAVNHPVDSATTHADPFDYGRVALLAGNGPTGATVFGPLGGILGATTHNLEWTDPPPSGNRGFLMPYPRTAQQAGHAPICQQCHHNSREVGSLSGDGSQATAASAQIAAADGVRWSGNATTGSWVNSLTDNPRFQNFPHETLNYRMLVSATPEGYTDDLCLNCHPPAALP